MKAGDYIAPEHADKPRFRAFVEEIAGAFEGATDKASEIRDRFDLDVAVGDQLDIIGQWVGIGRDVKTPISGVYFSWGDSTHPHNTGWSYGVWKGPYDPATGIKALDDDTFRHLIRARIEVNQWDGSIPGIERIWDTAFPKSQATLVIQDTQDMSMIIGLSNFVFPGLHRAILDQGFIPIKPAGVNLHGFRFVNQNAPLFAWGSISFFDPPADATLVVGPNPAYFTQMTNVPANSSNLTHKSNFEDGLIGDWSSSTSNLVVASVSGQPFTKALQATATNSGYDVIGTPFPTSPGDVILFDGWGDASNSTSNFQFAIHCFDSNGNYVGSPAFSNCTIAAGSAMAEVSGSVTVPTGTAKAFCHINWHPSVGDVIEAGPMFYWKSQPVVREPWVLADGEHLEFVTRTETADGWGTGAWGEIHYGA